MTWLAALVLTTAQVEVLTLGDLGRAAGTEVEASIADEVVIRRTTQSPVDQIKLIASGVGYLLQTEKDKIHLRGPRTGKPGKLRVDRFPEIASLLAAQTFDFTALPPGQRVVLSSSPTRLQLPLIGKFDKLTWIAAHRGIYGLSFTKSGSYDQHGFDALFFFHGNPDPGVPLSPKVREWMFARRQSVAVPLSPLTYTLAEDPVALMYTELLNARFAKSEQFVFLAKDSTVMGPVAALMSGRVQVNKVWRGLDDMYGLTLTDEDGVWVSNYSESGVALSAPIRWYRKPEKWTPERLARMSLEEAAKIVATQFDKSLADIVTRHNDSDGVSALRSPHEGLVLWHGLTSEQRAAARAAGSIRLPVLASRSLAESVERLLFGGGYRFWAGKRPPAWQFGDAWDELTFRFGSGLPGEAELQIEVTHPIALVMQAPSARYYLLDEDGLASNLEGQMRKNPGSDRIKASFSECAEVRPETINLTLRVGELLVFQTRIKESVPAEGLKMVPYESVDAGLRQRALNRAKRLAPSFGG